MSSAVVRRLVLASPLLHAVTRNGAIRSASESQLMQLILKNDVHLKKSMSWPALLHSIYPRRSLVDVGREGEVSLPQARAFVCLGARSASRSFLSTPPHLLHLCPEGASTTADLTSSCTLYTTHPHL